MSGFAVTTNSCEHGVSKISVSGYLDAHTAPELEKAFQTLVNDGQFKILVDFEGLDYISSAGLGVFMGFIEEVRSNSGDIKMCSMATKIYKVFDLLGFPSLYEIFDEEVQALEKFRA